MPPKPEGLLAREAAMYKDDLKRLGTSDKDNLLRKRLTTALAALRTFTAVQKKQYSLLRRAQEDATRLADEFHILERKGSSSNSQLQPQPGRTRPRRACSAALSHEDRLEIAKDRHDRAVERVRQIECEYAELLTQARAAISRARWGIWELTIPEFMTSRDSTGHPSPPTSGPSNNAPAKDAVSRSPDASGDETLPPPTGPYADIEVDMTRSLSQSLQGRWLLLIYSNFKKTYAMTWNEGGQEVRAVVKLTPRSDAKRLRATRREIANYQHLRSLQGTCIPRLLDYGRTELDGKKYFAIVMERIEDREFRSLKALDIRPSIAELSDQERTACWEVITKIHNLGVIRRDIRGSNLMFRDNLPGPNRIPVLIGLGEAAIVGDADDEYREEEREDLYDVFRENRTPSLTF